MNQAGTEIFLKMLKTMFAVKFIVQVDFPATTSFFQDHNRASTLINSPEGT